MELLANIAEKNRSILNEIIEIIKVQKATGSPAIQVGGKKLIERLK